MQRQRDIVQTIPTLIVVILLITSACTGWEPASCPSGRFCPPNATCAADQDVCIATPCGNGVPEAQENEECDDGNIISGDGCNHLCQSEGCGNGIVDLREVCDDGNVASGDGCNAACLSEYCGDGKVDEAFGEELDTEVGERGSRLSMGQRQLVSLMRVLIQRPAIFILDEATASIDPFTECRSNRH